VRTRPAAPQAGRTLIGNGRADHRRAVIQTVRLMHERAFSGATTDRGFLHPIDGSVAK